MKKIYLFKLVGEDIEDDADFAHPFFAEIVTVIGEDDLKYLGFTKNDDIFMTLNDDKIERVTKLIQKYFIFSKTDVTEKVLSGEIQREYPEVEKELFEIFRFENTTIDDVLDKINCSGIESLDYIDKIILESK